MAKFQSIDEFLTAWSEVSLAPDPHRALASAGHTVAPSLAAQLARPAPHRLRPEQRMQLLNRLRSGRGRGRLSFADGARFTIQRRQRPVLHALPEGEFDVVASVRLEVADQILAGLYTTHVLPHALPAGEVPHAVLGLLQALSDDVPSDENMTVGAVHFTAPPTAEVGPGGAVRLTQPLRVDVDLVRDGIPRTTVTSLSGVFRYDARPEANPSPTEPTVTVIALDLQLGLNTEEFEVSADSLIQPRDADALTTFTNTAVPLIAGEIRKILSGREIPISPNLRLPFDRDVAVRVLAAQATTSATELGSGALHIGLLVGLGEETDPPEIPAQVVLDPDPLGRSAMTAVVSVHQATLQAIAAASVAALQDKVDDKVLPILGIFVNSATVDLRPPDTLRLLASAQVLDFCGPGPFNFIDLDFDAVLDAEASVVDGTVRFEGDPSINLDNTDAAICVISSLFDAALLSAGDVLFVLGGLIIGKIWIETSDTLGERSRDFNGVFEPRRPVVGTELAPRGEVLQVMMTEDRLVFRGSLELHQDTEHIFAYVQVLEGPFPQEFLNRTPVPGATVEVLDQDTPGPPDDDFIPPTVETPIFLRGQKVDIRLDLSIEAPPRDEVIGTATTDDDGIVRLIMDRSRAGGAGATLITKKTTFFKTVEKDPVTTFTRTPIREALPDVYLRVTMPDGRRIDSRRPDGTGLVVNLDSDHLGSAAAPMTFVVRSGIVVPEDPEKD